MALLIVLTIAICIALLLNMHGIQKTSPPKIFSILLSAAMIGVMACSSVTSFLVSPQPPSATPLPADTATAELPVSTPIIKLPTISIAPTSEVQLTPMAVTIVADPPMISPGAKTTIKVEVYSPAATPVTDAVVQIEAEHGVFSANNDSTITGKTDYDGIFAAEWQCPSDASSPSEYSFTVKMSKAGFVDETQDIQVHVR